MGARGGHSSSWPPGWTLCPGLLAVTVGSRVQGQGDLQHLCRDQDSRGVSTPGTRARTRARKRPLGTAVTGVKGAAQGGARGGGRDGEAPGTRPGAGLAAQVASERRLRNPENARLSRRGPHTRCLRNAQSRQAAAGDSIALSDGRKAGCRPHRVCKRARGNPGERTARSPAGDPLSSGRRGTSRGHDAGLCADRRRR